MNSFSKVAKSVVEEERRRRRKKKKKKKIEMRTNRQTTKTNANCGNARRHHDVTVIIIQANATYKIKYTNSAYLLFGTGIRSLAIR